MQKVLCHVQQKHLLKTVTFVAFFSTEKSCELRKSVETGISPCWVLNKRRDFGPEELKFSSLTNKCIIRENGVQRIICRSSKYTFITQISFLHGIYPRFYCLTLTLILWQRDFLEDSLVQRQHPCLLGLKAIVKKANLKCWNSFQHTCNSDRRDGGFFWPASISK